MFNATTNPTTNATTKATTKLATSNTNLKQLSGGRSLAILVLAFLPAFAAIGGEKDFHAGELIPQFGRIAEVPDAKPLPTDTRLKLAIDIVEGGKEGVINSKFQTAASFLNLQHANGIPADQIDVALVVHGPAHRDLLVNKAYGGANPNAEILAALQEHGVKVFYCGQSAVYRDVTKNDLLPGVEITHSATTTHVLLQQQGYALRP
ncbi:MAG: DsrE family protein [Pseudomonadota bacterium]